jgi:hypothetical protein
VEVPDLIHDLRWGQGQRRHGDEIEELLVFLDRTQGLFGRPMGFAGQARGERIFVAGTVDLEILNTLPEVAVGGHGAVSFMSWLERIFSNSSDPLRLCDVISLIIH